MGGNQLGHSLPCQDRWDEGEEDVGNSVGCLGEPVSGECLEMEMGAGWIQQRVRMVDVGSGRERRGVEKGNGGSQQCHTEAAGGGVLSILSCFHPWRFLEKANSLACQIFQI